MAVFGTGSTRIGGGRGPTFGFRFFCYAVISVVLMFYDRKGGFLDTARYGLQAAIYPLQLAVNSPSAAWRWLEESFTARETLRAEVDRLREELRKQQLITMRQEVLEKENATLRGLTTVLPNVIEKRLVGEVISVELSNLRQRLLINRGGSDGVFKSQPVITGDGVLGQVFRTGPFSSEIILITDSEHGLPVQVLRSGVRTIALGTGRSTSLELPYVPQNYDVKVGDVLVTSGLGRVFPFGLPVARVTKVQRDPTLPLAQIYAVPLAGIENDREVLFIWQRPNHPDAPAAAEALAVEAAARTPAKPPAMTPARKPVATPAPAQSTAPTPSPTQQPPTLAPSQAPAQTPAPTPASEQTPDTTPERTP